MPSEITYYVNGGYPDPDRPDRRPVRLEEQLRELRIMLASSTEEANRLREERDELRDRVAFLEEAATLDAAEDICRLPAGHPGPHAAVPWLQGLAPPSAPPAPPRPSAHVPAAPPRPAPAPPVEEDRDPAVERFKLLEID